MTSIPAGTGSAQPPYRRLRGSSRGRRYCLVDVIELLVYTTIMPPAIPPPGITLEEKMEKLYTIAEHNQQRAASWRRAAPRLWAEKLHILADAIEAIAARTEAGDYSLPPIDECYREVRQ